MMIMDRARDAAGGQQGGGVAGALARGSRITGSERQELAAELAERYAAGESLRTLAEDTGRSFGFVHGLVKESGVELRSRGGATRGAAAEARRAAVAQTRAGAAGATTAAGKDAKKPKAAKRPKDDGKKSKKGKKR